MNKNVFPLIGFLITNACASATVPHAFRAIGFTENEITILERAASEWSIASNGKYNLMIVDANGCDEDTCSTIHIVDKITNKSKIVGITVENLDAGYAVGITDAKNDDLGVRTENDKVTADAELYDVQILNMRSGNLRTCAWGENDGWDEVLFRVSMHEFGHVLGKKHINKPWNVMSKYCSTNANSPTEADLTD